MTERISDLNGDNVEFRIEEMNVAKATKDKTMDYFDYDKLDVSSLYSFNESSNPLSQEQQQEKQTMEEMKTTQTKMAKQLNELSEENVLLKKHLTKHLHTMFENTKKETIQLRSELAKNQTEIKELIIQAISEYSQNSGELIGKLSNIPCAYSVGSLHYSPIDITEKDKENAKIANEKIKNLFKPLEPTVASLKEVEKNNGMPEGYVIGLTNKPETKMLGFTYYGVGAENVGGALKNSNLQLRSDPPIAKTIIGPWNISSIAPTWNMSSIAPNEIAESKLPVDVKTKDIKWKFGENVKEQNNSGPL